MIWDWQIFFRKCITLLKIKNDAEIFKSMELGAYEKNVTIQLKREQPQL